jgi:hypothetical protein
MEESVKHSIPMVLSWFIFVTSPALAEAPRTEKYEGVARSPSGELLYRERHEVTEVGSRPLRATTVYYDASGAEIGRLESDFSKSSYAPSYRFEDRRAKRAEGAHVSGSTVTLRYGGERKELRVDPGETLVAGQGLHHFARINLDKLARASASVRFAIPSRLDTYGFRVRPLPSPRAGVVRLRIEVSSIILRQLAPNLEVDYEVATRRLLRYRGVSNLEGPGGSTQEVIIAYTYGGGQ